MNDHIESEWEFFFTKLDEKPYSISLDLSLADSPRQSSYPVLARVHLYLKHPDENGFTTAEENETLGDLEDALVDKLASAALLAGKVTGAGRLILFFYARTEEGVEQAADEALGTDYEYAVETEEDRGWDAYRDFLYPDEYDFKAINNRRVLTQLEEQGDALQSERDIDHWAYFKTEADAAAFGKAIAEHGFRTLSVKTGMDDPEHPVSVSFSRSDSPGLANINAITWYLMDTAGEHNGEYDGWGSMVVKGVR